MIVFTVRPQNDKILIVSDKFWDKIVCDIFRHFKYLSQVRPTILDIIKWNNYRPSPPPNAMMKARRSKKRAILASLKWGEGWSRCSIYFVQDCRPYVPCIPYNKGTLMYCAHRWPDDKPITRSTQRKQHWKDMRQMKTAKIAESRGNKRRLGVKCTLYIYQKEMAWMSLKKHSPA